MKLYSNISKFKELLLKEIKGTEVILTTHKGFDDDAIGSILALNSILKKYCKPKMYLEDNEKSRYEFFSDYKKINFVYDLSEVSEDKIVIGLDGNDISRFTNNDVKIDFCIDHHHTKKAKFKHHLYLDLSSNCEIIFKLFEDEIKKKEAEYLMLGILGDTGNFSFVSSKTSSAFLAAKKLVDISKMSIQEFQSNYNKVSKEGFLEFKKVLKTADIKQIGDWPSFLYGLCERGDETGSEASSMFNYYFRIIDEVNWGFVIKQRDDFCTISFRSLPGSVNVRLLAEELGGGGHDRAAGCLVKGSLNTVKKKVFNLLKNKDFNDFS